MSGLRAELERVLGLCGKATAGPLWAEEEISGGAYTLKSGLVRDNVQVGEIYAFGGPGAPFHEEAVANRDLACAAVNFLRQYGPALLTGQGEDGRAKVWRCSNAWNNGDGSVTGDTKYAKTEADMLILRDQGYRCEPINV